MSVRLTVDNKTGAQVTLQFTPPAKQGAPERHVLNAGASGTFSLTRGTLVSATALGQTVLPAQPITISQTLPLTMKSGQPLPVNYGCKQALRIALAGAAATALLGLAAVFQQKHHRLVMTNGMTPEKCRAEFGDAFCAKYEAGVQGNEPGVFSNAYGRAAVGMAVVTAVYWAYTQSTFLTTDTCMGCQLKGGQWTGTSQLCTHLDLCDCHT